MMLYYKLLITNVTLSVGLDCLKKMCFENVFLKSEIIKCLIKFVETGKYFWYKKL